MTRISYLDEVVNPVVGCTKGCPECWAREVVRRQALNPKLSLPDDKRGRMMKFLPTFIPQRLDAMKRMPKGSAVGVCFTGDLFDPMLEPDLELWDSEFYGILAALRPDCSYVFLTKRYANMATVFCDQYASGAQDNWFLGMSCRDQGELDDAAPQLRRLAAAGWKTWISLEPLRGPVDLGFLELGRWNSTGKDLPLLNPKGVILGGPSGPKAWPIHPDWVRAVRDQCAAAGVPFYFKQWDTAPVDTGMDVFSPMAKVQVFADHGHGDIWLPMIDRRFHAVLPWGLRKSDRVRHS